AVLAHGGFLSVRAADRFGQPSTGTLPAGGFAVWVVWDQGLGCAFRTWRLGRIHSGLMLAGMLGPGTAHARAGRPVIGLPVAFHRQPPWRTCTPSSNTKPHRTASRRASYAHRCVQICR